MIFTPGKVSFKKAAFAFAPHDRNPWMFRIIAFPPLRKRGPEGPRRIDLVKVKTMNRVLSRIEGLFELL